MKLPRRTSAALMLVTLVAASACTSGGTDSSEATLPGPAGTGTSPPPTPVGAAVIAHRGASASAPEHTLAAYDLALEQGADYIEQDLQLTADGQLVVLHDVVLDRTARGPADSCTGPVQDKTLDQLRACDVGSWFNEAHPDLADPAFVDQRIPTMAELIDRYGTGTRYYIEIKSPAEQPGIEDTLLDLLDDAGLSSSDQDGRPQVIIQSFSADSLRHLHDLRPDLVLVQLVSATAGPIDAAALDEIATYADAIGPSVELVGSTLITDAHERCLAVHPYTVDDPAIMAELLDSGVDGIFTNVPAQLVTVRADHPGNATTC